MKNLKWLAFFIAVVAQAQHDGQTGRQKLVIKRDELCKMSAEKFCAQSVSDKNVLAFETAGKTGAEIRKKVLQAIAQEKGLSVESKSLDDLWQQIESGKDHPAALKYSIVLRKKPLISGRSI